jgi:hypothetical protein
MFKYLLLSLLGFAFILFALVKVSDRACDQNYSAAYRLTAQYRAMECPVSK